MGSDRFNDSAIERFNDLKSAQAASPRSPTLKNGYFYVNEAPGFGVDLNEELAKKCPYREDPRYWRPLQRKGWDECEVVRSCAVFHLDAGVTTPRIVCEYSQPPANR
ncbi:MAG: hypothetical protein HYY24_24545 [Verrucomicrobia bacterium]|nr:hypothetical protein [Verrucomicrobiota bacterium]